MSWMQGKTVLVTGGSQGIGQATAALFRDAGAHVTVTGTRGAASDYADSDLAGMAYVQCRMGEKADIEANLTQHDLCSGAVAARHGISDRYLRSLFARDQTSFSDFVAARRLALVCRQLTEPRHATRSISRASASSVWRTGFPPVPFARTNRWARWSAISCWGSFRSATRPSPRSTAS